MSSNDKDFDYKHRFQRVLWMMGFWTRIEIPVLAYSINTYVDNLKKHDLTDIDVYGEQINLDFSINKYIGDCKSGKNVKSTERIFWLKGVMDYTEANKGFLIKKSVSQNIRLILDKLGIYAVDDANLVELEKLYHTNAISDLYSPEYYTEREKLVSLLTDEYKKIYQFLSQRYWYNQSHVNLAVITSMLNKDDFYKNFQTGNKVQTFLLLEIIIFYCRLLNECCNYVLHRNIADIQQCVLEYVHGGVSGLNTKKNLVREMKSLLNNYLPNDNININENDVTPLFYKPLLEIVITLISEPAMSRDTIRYLEVYQHEVIMNKKYNY